ncbi:hypothetical protein ACWDYH_38720 [Nocardia goodfellowii]|uniref:Uncharacterized protein n=1 Tax=Nocardia goodfellowii TaxID=882446 RepID=A0ABS4QRP6_9NOCA|nr:hypothetical protein [Nocardia goodfellowii]MBP2193778.1 hypothetical protein [Nocardia goodfellowii]
MKAVVGPADRVITVGTGPAPRTTGKRRGKSFVLTERRIMMGAALPTRRAIRLPKSCAATATADEQTGE